MSSKIVADRGSSFSWTASCSLGLCKVMEKISDYLDSEVASIMANIATCPCNGAKHIMSPDRSVCAPIRQR